MAWSSGVLYNHPPVRQNLVMDVSSDDVISVSYHSLTGWLTPLSPARATFAAYGSGILKADPATGNPGCFYSLWT
jgi:hypothetical protein